MLEPKVLDNPHPLLLPFELVRCASEVEDTALQIVSVNAFEFADPADIIDSPTPAQRMVFGEQASHLSLVSSGAAHIAAQSNQESIASAEEEVRAALPAARSAVLIRGVVVRERRATFSVAPGQPPRPGVRTGIVGLFLAGDWIDSGLPATIESAVWSGHRVADAVQADRQKDRLLGLMPSPPIAAPQDPLQT